jgi:hypothetical protein
MDWKRLAKKNLIPFYNTKDLISKIQDNGFIDGVKQKMKEDFIEDMPIIGNIYDYAKAEGKYIGKYEGYVKASNDYENKFIKQANEFLNQIKDIKNQRDEYEQLLNDYDKYIDEMMHKDNLSKEEKADMNEMIITERKLRGLVTKEISYSNNTTPNLLDYDERGFIKNTAKHKNGTKYDDKGFDKFGYDKKGYNKEGLDKYGTTRNIVPSITKYDEGGFIKNTARHKNGTKFDDQGFDKFGYDKNGFDKNGFDKCGHPRKL